MAEGKTTRKLDSHGRILIPIKLREQMGLVSGQEYDFSTQNINGHRFILIDCGPVDTELERALEIVRKNGMKVE